MQENFVKIDPYRIGIHGEAMIPKSLRWWIFDSSFTDQVVKFTPSYCFIGENIIIYLDIPSRRLFQRFSEIINDLAAEIIFQNTC